MSPTSYQAAPPRIKPCTLCCVSFPPGRLLWTRFFLGPRTRSRSIVMPPKLSKQSFPRISLLSCKARHFHAKLLIMVPKGGLEPPRAQCALPPQDSVSTNSTTSACSLPTPYTGPTPAGKSPGSAASLLGRHIVRRDVVCSLPRCVNTGNERQIVVTRQFHCRL